MYLEPLLARLGVRFELHGLLLAKCFVVLLVELGAHQLGIQLPRVLPQEIFARQLFAFSSLHLAQPSLVNVDEAPLAIQGEEGIGSTLEDVLSPPVRFSQRLLGSLALGDVTVDPQKAGQLALLAPDSDID